MLDTLKLILLILISIIRAVMNG